MAFILNDYIESYIQETKAFPDKDIARHLKEIVPKTAHLDEKIFNEIVEELKKKMDEGMDFKSAFHEACKKYILKGNVITAALPRILTRIIPNVEKFITNLVINIENRHRRPYRRRELKMVFSSGGEERIVQALRKLRRVKLSRSDVVFATFDEKDGNSDPFFNRQVIEIINMLALDKNVFDEGEPYTAVRIGYKNGSNFDKKYPTFIDAGWRDTFCPADKEDKYGRTKSRDSSLPNMPEVAHKNMKLSDIEIDAFECLEDR